VLLEGILARSTPCGDYETTHLVYRNNFEGDTETRDARRKGALL
jgi:hypothetical protein